MSETSNTDAAHTGTARQSAGAQTAPSRHASAQPQSAQPQSTRHATTSSRRSAKRRNANRHRRARRGGWRPFNPQELAQRRAAVPTITYPEELPVSARREDIKRAIANNQVVIVAGETGSGKTTQLPKILLELGRGITGMIGHTQPRRIAARSVAERICQELGVQLGGAIGYQVRFTEEVSRRTLVKLMTDGILLAEIQSDPQLLRYDTIIIDEAHERSLNIDFLLGYLARLLPQRPDLKLIITSATIDTDRFAAHFGEHQFGGHPGLKAPIVEVSGRTYPVEIRYRPLDEELTSYTSDSEDDVDGVSGFDADSGTASAAIDDAAPLSSAASALPDWYRPPTHGARTAQVRKKAASKRKSASSKNGTRTPSSKKPGTPGRAQAKDQVTGILEAADELMAEGPGDILVFLSGQGEIRDTERAFKDGLGAKYVAPGQHSSVPGAVEVLPLFARLSGAEQHRIFERHSHRRIILATNIAETSLTVPGIRYVIDPGTARISRYSNKTKVQRLPIEPISQASANQRSGRSGRVADGIAIRLYSEEDFAAREEFTQPEIQRTSLASVILQMASLGLGSADEFPFIDPPDPRAVRAGVQLLEEIDAIDPATHALTGIGRQLAQLPLDPRLGRMLIEGEKNGTASEMLVLVAAMSVQDVRERPADKRELADQYHARFNASSSDFLTYLTLWRYLRTQQRELSGSQFRRMCRGEFLNYLRFREWQDVVRQLEQMARPLHLHVHPLAIPTPAQIAEKRQAGAGAPGAVPNAGAVVTACRDLARGSAAPDAGAIHRSLLVGLLSNIGNYAERSKEYQGTRGTRFVIWPGSGLHRRTPAWVMAAELVETSRLFARTVATIRPKWIEPLAGNLVKRTYSDAYWSSKRGAAMAKEKVMLYGLPVVADRPVLLATTGTPHAAEDARAMFIRHGLIAGDWRERHAFLDRNREALEEAREEENKLRTRGLVADEDALFTFYDERLPETIVSGTHFNGWWKKRSRQDPHYLDFTRELLLGEAAASEGDFPSEWHQRDLTFSLEYTFNPGGYGDGVTVVIPVSLLSRVTPDGFDWLVPGMRQDLVIGTIRALPKRVRRELVPAPDVARQIEPLLPSSGEAGFQEAFTAAVRQVRGVEIDDAAWRELALPDHLRMHFRVTSERGAVLDESTSLEQLQRSLAPQTKKAVETVVQGAVAQALDEARRNLERANAHRGRKATDGKNGTGKKGTAPGGRDRHDAQGNGTPARERAHTTGSAQRGGAAAAYSTQALTDWPAVDQGVIPQVIETEGPHGMTVRAYPALTARKGRVYMDVFAEPGEQVREHRRGVIQLLALTLALPEVRVTSRWSGDLALKLAGSPYPSTAALVKDVQLAAARNLADRWAKENRTAVSQIVSGRAWGEMLTWARDAFEDEVFLVAQGAAKACAEWSTVERLIKDATSVALLGTVADEKAHMAALMPAGFISATPTDRLWDLPRYLQAAAMRIEKAQVNPAGDDALAWQVQGVSEKLAGARDEAKFQPFSPHTAAILTRVRWAIEEFRVSLFAQQLGTKGKVSAKRISKMLTELPFEV